MGIEVPAGDATGRALQPFQPRLRARSELPQTPLLQAWSLQVGPVGPAVSGVRTSSGRLVSNASDLDAGAPHRDPAGSRAMDFRPGRTTSAAHVAGSVTRRMRESRQRRYIYPSSGTKIPGSAVRRLTARRGWEAAPVSSAPWTILLDLRSPPAQADGRMSPLPAPTAAGVAATFAADADLWILRSNGTWEGPRHCAR